MEFKDLWLTNNRPKRKLTPKGVCVHWTANKNKGANAIANRNYFENHPNIYASAHYVVDDAYVVRCIPENEIAWHCGGEKNSELAKRLFNGRQNNYLIGIEMCVNVDGDWNKTYQNTVELVADIFKRYNWTTENLYRHFDMTGKDCPLMFTKYDINGEQNYLQFKKDIQEKVVDILIEDWQKEIGERALDNLNKKGFVSNSEDWKNKLADAPPNWLFFEMINRLVNKIEVK